MNRRKGLGLYSLIAAAHCVGFISIVAATMLFEVYGIPRPEYIRNDPGFLQGAFMTGVQYYVLWEFITGFVVISFLSPILTRGRISKVAGLFLVILAVQGVVLFQMTGSGYAILAEYIGVGALPALIALLYALKGTVEYRKQGSFS